MEYIDGLQTWRQPVDINTNLPNAIWRYLIRTHLTHWFQDSFLNFYSGHALFETDKPKGLSEWIFKAKTASSQIIADVCFSSIISTSVDIIW